MIRKLFPPIVLLLILLSGPKCIPEHHGPDGTLIGKLVVDTYCSNYVISVVQGNINPYPVAVEWKDPDSNLVYVNAFAVANRCTFDQFGLSKGELFSFEMDTMPPMQTCMICQIAYPAPAYSHAIKNVKKLN